MFCLIGFNYNAIKAQTVSPDDTLFFDDFESNTLRQWNDHDNIAQIIQESDGNRVLRLQGRDDWTGIDIPASEGWTDYAVETRIKIIQRTTEQEPSFFLNIRQSRNSHYWAFVDPDTWQKLFINMVREPYSCYNPGSIYLRKIARA